MSLEEKAIKLFEELKAKAIELKALDNAGQAVMGDLLQIAVLDSKLQVLAELLEVPYEYKKL